MPNFSVYDRLSYRQLGIIAPAAAEIRRAGVRVPNSHINDTSEFLHEIESFGFYPVFATQGRAHRDGRRPDDRLSRHLVVAASVGGLAIAVLNGHRIDRRTWLGIGFMLKDNNSFVVVHALPVVRSKGLMHTFEKLVPRSNEINSLRVKFNWHEVGRRNLCDLAGLLYPRHAKKPNPDAFHERVAACTHGLRALDIAHWMFNVARDGSLPRADVRRRAVKGIKSPDSIMFLASSLYDVMSLNVISYGHLRIEGADFNSFALHVE